MNYYRVVSREEFYDDRKVDYFTDFEISYLSKNLKYKLSKFVDGSKALRYHIYIDEIRFNRESNGSYTVFITKHIDDYYYVRSNSRRGSFYVICDQFDGLVKYFIDMKWINK